MPKSFAPVADHIRGFLSRRPRTVIAAAALFIAAGAAGVGLSVKDTAVTEAEAAPVSLDSQAVADVRARIKGGRLRPAVAALPAVSREMSDTAFFAVVENAVTIAGEDHLAERFNKLSPEQLAREQKCLAQAIYFEARSEGAMGKLAVAEVVLTRVADKRYPGTICGVVFQGSHLATGCQFSFTCDGLSDVASERGAWRKSQALARYVMLDVQWDRVTGDATHYHADYVAPYWAPHLEEVTTVGKHIFYRWLPPDWTNS